MHDPDFDPDWDDSDDEDDDDFDEEYAYGIHWPSAGPLTIERASSWTARRHLRVDAQEDEVWVYWQYDLDGTDKAYWNSRAGRMCFDEDPFDVCWEYVQREGKGYL